MSVAQQDSAVFRALADPTRREILDQLRIEPLRTGALAERFSMSRFGVRKHLEVLKEAGLVLTETRGRERWLRINPIPIRELQQRWIRSFEIQPADQLLDLKRLAESPPTTRENPMSTVTPCEVRHILLEVSISAPRGRVWQALVHETTQWWHKDFYTVSDPAGFHIEPELGGKMFEDWGDGNGQIWGQVVGIRTDEFLQVMGDSSKEWGGPSRNIMTWRLEEAEGGTTLRFESSIFGQVSQGTADSLDSGWKQLFEDCLKPFAEGVAAE